MSVRVGSALSAIAVTALMAGCASVAPIPTTPLSQGKLVGDWKLTDVGSQGVSRGLTISFRQDGTVTGTVKCNTLGGRYVAQPQTVRLLDVVITTGGCGSGWPVIIERAEQALFAPSTTAFLSSDGRHLYINGSQRLRFERTT